MTCYTRIVHKCVCNTIVLIVLQQWIQDRYKSKISRILKRRRIETPIVHESRLSNWYSLELSAASGYGHLAGNIDLSASSYWMQISPGCSCLFGTSARSFCPIEVSATYKFIPLSWLVCSNVRRKLWLDGMKSLRAITRMKGCHVSKVWQFASLDNPLFV